MLKFWELGHVCEEGPEFRWLKQTLLGAISRTQGCTSLLAN